MYHDIVIWVVKLFIVAYDNYDNDWLKVEILLAIWLIC
jgi:hypothetical protein